MPIGADSPSVNRRAGLTLIEVSVSLVLATIVSLLVYGAAQAARDTQARITHERRALQSALLMRVLLENALAGAQTDFLAPDTLFVLEHRANDRGAPRDRLRFVAAGDLPPLSPGADWSVTLEPTPRGLRLTGKPLGMRTPERLLALLPGVTGLAVKVHERGAGARWSEEWTFPIRLPDAVELTYWAEAGPTGFPLRVLIALGSER